MALTMTAARAALDAALSGVSHVEWSENGSAVSANLAATAVTLESAADLSSYARKGIDVGSPPLLSAQVTGACTITHWRFTTAASGGTAKTAWNALTSPQVKSVGQQISLADAAIGEKLTLA